MTGSHILAFLVGAVVWGSVCMARISAVEHALTVARSAITAERSACTAEIADRVAGCAYDLEHCRETNWKNANAMHAAMAGQCDYLMRITGGK